MVRTVGPREAPVLATRTGRVATTGTGHEPARIPLSVDNEASWTARLLRIGRTEGTISIEGRGEFGRPSTLRTRSVRSADVRDCVIHSLRMEGLDPSDEFRVDAHACVDGSIDVYELGLRTRARYGLA